MRELSLFTGAGGGLLGTHLLGWEPCGYVEWNKYCQQVIAARIRDGYLPVAPIFTDVREFVQSGAALQYRGIADVVTAGFPCQPFSVAGKQQAANDARNMWPATADVIRVVQPVSVLLENVPGLVSCGYLGTVLGDLAEMGFVGRWGILGAGDAGAPHKRNRLWILANAKGEFCDGRDHHRRGDRVNAHQVSELGNGSYAANLANPSRQGLAQRVLHARGVQGEGGSPEGQAAFVGGSWWASDPGDEPESGVGRVANGVAHRVERLKALGNGQVPAVVRRAWQELAA